MVGNTIFAFNRDGEEIWQLRLADDEGIPIKWQVADIGIALGADGTLYLSGRGAIVALR